MQQIEESGEYYQNRFEGNGFEADYVIDSVWEELLGVRENTPQTGS